MVMRYLLLAVGETAARAAAIQVVGKLAGRDKIEDLERERMEAEKDATRQRLAAMAMIEQAANPPPEPASVAVSTETGAPCPSCTLYEETSLAQSYAATIVQHCGDAAEIPPGYGGTILQVREHLGKAITAARRLDEKPQFAQAGAMMAQGLQGLLDSLSGAKISCNQIKTALPSLQEAVGVADRIAVLWWKKPDGAPVETKTGGG